MSTGTLNDKLKCSRSHAHILNLISCTPDVWASRILVTAISGSTVYLIQGFVTFFLENPELVMDTVQLALKTWGQVV